MLRIACSFISVLCMVSMVVGADCEVTEPYEYLLAVKINFDWDPSQDSAISIAWDPDTPLDSAAFGPEYVTECNGINTRSDPVCMIGGSSTKFKVQFCLLPPQPPPPLPPMLAFTSIRAKSTNPTILPHLKEVVVKFENNVSEWVEFEFESPVSPSIGLDLAITYMWIARNGEWEYGGDSEDPTLEEGEVKACTTHEAYSLLAKPLPPWEHVATSGPRHLPWANALYANCTQANGIGDETGALGKFTEWVFSHTVYRSAEGGTPNLAFENSLTHPWTFDYRNYLNSVDFSGGSASMACYGCCMAAGTKARLVGVSCQMIKKEIFGPIQVTAVCGLGQTNSPFHKRTSHYRLVDVIVPSGAKPKHPTKDDLPYDFWDRETATILECVDYPAHCPSFDLAVGDRYHRSMFTNHTWLRHTATLAIFDPCLGPFIGVANENDYLMGVIETSLVGYYDIPPGPGNTEWVFPY